MRCPAALSKLEDLACKPENSEIALFVSIALSQGVGNIDTATSLLEDDAWGHIEHYFAELEEKERIKELFGITKVPYLIVLDEVG